MEELQDELLAVVSGRKTLEEIRLGSIIANSSISGTKEGNNHFDSWKREKINEYTDKRFPKKETLFSVLKNENSKKKSNTVFDKLKWFKNHSNKGKEKEK